MSNEPDEVEPAPKDAPVDEENGPYKDQMRRKLAARQDFSHEMTQAPDDGGWS